MDFLAFFKFTRSCCLEIETVLLFPFHIWMLLNFFFLSYCSAWNFHYNVKRMWCEQVGLSCFWFWDDVQSFTIESDVNCRFFLDAFLSGGENSLRFLVPCIIITEIFRLSYDLLLLLFSQSCVLILSAGGETAWDKLRRPRLRDRLPPGCSGV